MKETERRQFWVILLIVFLGFIGISMPYLIFPALFLNPEYTIIPAHWGDSSRAIWLGITLAAYPLGQFFGSPILGSLSDDYGRKKLLSGSLLVAGLCNLLSGFAIVAEQLPLLVISRFAGGLMEGNIAIARAMAADLTTISKHEGFGKINAAASIAFLIGPLIGGLISDRTVFEYFTPATPFYGICLIFVVLAVLSSIVLNKGITNKPLESRSFFERINLFQRLKALFKNRRLRFLMIVSTSYTLAIDVFYEFAPVYLTIKWTLNPAELIVYNAVLCAALAFGNGWLPAYLSSRVSNRRACIASMGGFAVFLIAIVLIETPWLMMLFLTLSGFVIGLGVTLLTVKISNSASDSIQGEVMGVQLSLRVLADAVICVLGGFLLLFSPKLILILAALISAGAVAYYAFYARANKLLVN